MEPSDILQYVIDHLIGMGAPGVIISILVVGISVLWRALQNERRNGKELVELMVALSRETAAMIERITGR